MEADMSMGTGGGDYRHFRLGGGNSDGFIYGSYPRWSDGIHFGYNFYSDAGGVSHFGNTVGGSSRISAGYAYIGLGTGLGASDPTDKLIVSGTGVCIYGTLNSCSDRNAKQDFTDVSPAEILEKVSHLTLSEWSYKADPKTRHLGPMAQDFHAAFNIGTDDKHIAPIDEGGVALAAIKGLNEKLQDELKRRDAENAALKHALEQLKQRVDLLSQRANL